MLHNTSVRQDLRYCTLFAASQHQWWNVARNSAFRWPWNDSATVSCRRIQIRSLCPDTRSKVTSVVYVVAYSTTFYIGLGVIHKPSACCYSVANLCLTVLSLRYSNIICAFIMFCLLRFCRQLFALSYGSNLCALRFRKSPPRGSLSGGGAFVQGQVSADTGLFNSNQLNSSLIVNISDRIFMAVTYRTMNATYFQVADATGMMAWPDFSTGQLDSGWIRPPDLLTSGQWSQRTGTMKPCHRWRIPTGIPENRILITATKYACISIVLSLTDGMMQNANIQSVQFARLKYNYKQVGRRLDSAPRANVVAMATKTGPHGRHPW